MGRRRAMLTCAEIDHRSGLPMDIEAFARRQNPDRFRAYNAILALLRPYQREVLQGQDAEWVRQ